MGETTMEEDPTSDKCQQATETVGHIFLFITSFGDIVILNGNRKFVLKFKTSLPAHAFLQTSRLSALLLYSLYV
jgi:hypothetical protein